MIPISNRLLIIHRLKKAIEALLEEDDGVFASIKASNPWFTEVNVRKMLQGLVDSYLSEYHLINWLEDYLPLPEDHKKSLGIVMAGNIPLVGFHDLICGILSGYHIKIKLSDKDAILTPYLLKSADISNDIIECVEILPKCDKVIATGSNNTSRYFEYYFREIPHVIRTNRTSVAVLDGKESIEELEDLANDILSYYGLGCRNVSKIFVPLEYDLAPIFEAVDSYKDYAHHHKYFNNFEYTSALYLLNREDFKSNGYFIIRESKELFSRISCVHVHRYDKFGAVHKYLEDYEDSIQCVATNTASITHDRKVSLGQCQSPQLSDYADGIDTMRFLVE